MNSIHAASKCGQFQELSVSEMTAVEGGNKIVDAVTAVAAGVVRFLNAVLFAHPYCVVPMTMGEPCT